MTSVRINLSFVRPNTVARNLNLSIKMEGEQTPPCTPTQKEESPPEITFDAYGFINSEVMDETSDFRNHEYRFHATHVIGI